MFKGDARKINSRAQDVTSDGTVTVAEAVAERVLKDIL